MIKKIVITLLAIILIIVISIVSLIVFVDPNNFRGFISDTVKDKTGYELTIEGNLRWHIWPKISILTDSIKLADQGAKKPILVADNMRLDVELFPLFSKELSVTNVFIKSAIINISDDSKGASAQKLAQNRQATEVNNPAQTLQSPSPKPTSSSSWTFSLNKFEINNSTVVLQQNDDLVTFRNLDLIVEQKSKDTVAVDINGNINRNQQDLFYAVKAEVDLASFPKKASIELHQFDYDYKGVGVPTGELKGNLSGTLNYQQSPLVIESHNLALSVNNNAISGSISLNLDNKPYTELNLNSEKIDITPFIVPSTETQPQDVVIQQTTPVVSTNVKNSGNELDFLTNFNANVQFNINELIVDKATLTKINMNASNDDGVATLNQTSFDFAGGHVTANGIANGKSKNLQIKLNTKIVDVDLNTFFSQVDIKNDLSGIFNATGELTTDTLSSTDLLANLRGNMAISIANARLNNINIPNIIQNAVSKYTKDILSSENQQKYTQFSKLSANAILNSGNMTLTSLKAKSETLDVDGTGRVGMVNRDLDVDLRIKMLGGWNGKSETLAKLKQLTIPLRIYGQFANLHYQIEIEQLIQDVLSDKLQQGLDKLRIKLQGQDSKSGSKQKSSDILSKFIKKIDK